MGITIFNKRILVIGIGFRDYENEIVHQLRKSNYVEHISSNPFPRLQALLNRFNLSLIRHKLVDLYISFKLKNLQNDFDEILIIKGENLNVYHINIINRKFVNVHKILYFWDSIIRMENANLLLSNFSNIVTFDRIDSIKYNLKFLPLFYRYSIDCNQDEDKYDYDLFFAGGYHSDRLKLVAEIKKIAEKKGVRFKGILVTGIFRCFIDKYIFRVISKEDRSLLCVKSIKYNKYIDYCRRSKSILDIAHPLQSGLTMRTMEAIGFNRNLITTNQDIVNYPEIPCSMYKIFDRNKLDIDFEFAKQIPWNKNITIFSIENFINELFNK